MPATPDATKARFARFIERALADARARGMTDKDIAKATGVSPSTFHRWRRGEVIPDTAVAVRFCQGLDIPPGAALAILGTVERDDPAPEPLTHPDLRAIQRKLLDPNTPDAEKTVILATIAHLAGRRS